MYDGLSYDGWSYYIVREESDLDMNDDNATIVAELKEEELIGMLRTLTGREIIYGRELK
jgi:hypothetical protein